MKKEMIKIATVCMLVSVVGFGCTQDTLRNAANREEALKVVCKKYGHDWTGWKFISPSESCLLTVDHLHFGGTEHETYPPWNWKRVCSVCSKLETKKSYSKTNPDVTKAMYDCATEVAKEACSELKKENWFVDIFDVIGKPKPYGEIIKVGNAGDSDSEVEEVMKSIQLYRQSTTNEMKRDKKGSR